MEIYFVLENPELGFSPRDYMDRPFTKLKGENKVPFDSYYNRQKEYRTNIKNIAKEFSNVTLLDPEKVFCDEAFCYSIRNNKMLYRDNDHLSTDGSLLQALAFKKYIFTQIN